MLRDAGVPAELAAALEEAKLLPSRVATSLKKRNGSKLVYEILTTQGLKPGDALAIINAFTEVSSRTDEQGSSRAEQQRASPVAPIRADVRSCSGNL